jgi:hypothetical protein
MVTCLKDFNKKMSSQIDGIRMPALDKYLDSKYAYVKTRTHVCDICNDFTGSNKQSISAHKRGCRKKHLSSNTVVTDTSSNSIEQNIEQV